MKRHSVILAATGADSLGIYICVPVIPSTSVSIIAGGNYQLFPIQGYVNGADESLNIRIYFRSAEGIPPLSPQLRNL